MSDYNKTMEEYRKLLWKSQCIPKGLIQGSTQTCASRPLTSSDMQEAYNLMISLVNEYPPIPVLSLPLKFIPSIHLTTPETKQVKFPKSKRKRIRKKLAKNQKNFRTMYVPSRIVYRKSNGDLYAHPEMIKEIEWGLKNDPAYFIMIKDIPEYNFIKPPEFELPLFSERKNDFHMWNQPLLRNPVKLIGDVKA